MGTHITAITTRVTGARRGILAGATPLIVAAIWVGLTLGSILFARWVTGGRSYVVQEQTAVTVAVVGLAFTAFAFALALAWTLHLVRNWLHAGLSRPAVAALWTLAATALIVLLPLLLAVLFPQHPAPPRPPDPVG